MLKFKEFQRKKTILHHTPFLFKKKENYQWLLTVKEWYGSYINIPVVYIPFMIAMIILKYYSRKIMNRFRRSPNITLLIQGQYQADDWDEYIQGILFAYRTSVHSSTKFTPFAIMYARKAKLPLQLKKMIH